MKCPKCNHDNVEAKFCEKCGTKLIDSKEGAALNSSAVSLETPSSSAGVYLNKSKSVAKNYYHFFLSVLKKPYPVSSSIGKDYLVNAIITMIFYAFLIPCIFYFMIKGMLFQIEKQFETDLFGGFMREIVPTITPSFGEVVIRPFFGFIVLIAIVSVLIFSALKLAKITVDVKEIIARFGAFLIPFVSILVVALILSILKLNLAFFVFIIGFFGSILLAPSFVIFSYKKTNSDGLDLVYGNILCYIATVIVLSIMANVFFESIVSSIQQLFSSFGI